MAHTSVNDQAFEACTRGVMQPNHINPLAADYHHIPRIFQPPQGEPEIGEDEAEYSEVLNCVMNEDADGLRAFRECEYYRITRHSKEMEDALEDDSDGEELMEDKEEHPVERSEAEANADADHINPDE